MRQAHVRSTTLHKGISRALYAGVFATAFCLSMSSNAWAQSEAPLQFDIPAQPMSAALKNFADQAGVQMLYRSEAVSNLMARSVRGSLDRRQALQQLLEGTGLEAVYSADDAVTIRPISPAAQSEAEKKSTGQAGMRSTTALESEATGQAEQPAPTSRATENTLDTVLVTGTRIRGGVSASPTITIGEQQFKEEGFADLGEVIRSIPQNFRGGQNPGVATGASQGAQSNQNITGSSALNLRGLGPDATLTLLNGRRLSYDGYAQAVDISAIPIDAVERIEIVPDGASAIYGSDAVGGVANVMLKRDFDGVTLGALYGDSADGGLERHEYTATAGATWDSGGLIATFKKSDQDPIYADQRDYTQAMYDPTTLYPGSTLRSGLLSAHQSLGDVAELRLDTMRTVRAQTANTAYSTYYFSGPTDTTVTLFAPSVQIALPRDWLLTAGTSRGKSESFYDSFLIRGGASTPSSSGAYFNESQAWELGIEGPLVTLGQRDVRLAAGIGGRTDNFSLRSFSADTRSGGDEHSRYAYGELLLPLVGADNARSGIHRFEVSAAVRSEDYDSLGRVTTPKFGVIYDPSPDFTIRASWGRSFKVPTLMQRNDRRYTTLWPARSAGCASCASDATVLFYTGGNRDLKPEHASTWTASLAFHPEAIPALDAELSFFSIDYTDRVISPIGNSSQTMSDPAYSEFIQKNPNAEKLAQIFAIYNEGMLNYSGAPYDPSKVAAAVASHYTNVARQRAKGLDLTGNYGFDLASGRMVFRGGMSWLDLSQRNSHRGEEFDLSGRIYFPARLNGRLGAVWSRGGLSVSAFANYTAGVTNTLMAIQEDTASFTTLDTTVRYEIAPGNTPLSGFSVALSVDNLFNRTPPLHVSSSFNAPPYDSTNYSAIGRYLTVSVSKHW